MRSKFIRQQLVVVSSLLVRQNLNLMVVAELMMQSYLSYQVVTFLSFFNAQLVKEYMLLVVFHERL